MTDDLKLEAVVEAAKNELQLVIEELRHRIAELEGTLRLAAQHNLSWAQENAALRSHIAELEKGREGFDALMSLRAEGERILKARIAELESIAESRQGSIKQFLRALDVPGDMSDVEGWQYAADVVARLSRLSRIEEAAKEVINPPKFRCLVLHAAGGCPDDPMKKLAAALQEEE